MIFLKQLTGDSSGSGDDWDALVRVNIDATKGGVDLRGVTVTGEWQGAFQGPVSGQTNRQGRVTFSTPELESGLGVVFRMTSVSHPAYPYDPSLNEADPLVVIPRPFDAVFAALIR